MCFHTQWEVFTCKQKFCTGKSTLTGMSSQRDEISSRQKRVNSKRHYTIDRDDFTPGRVSSRDEILLANTLLVYSLLSKVVIRCQLFLNYVIACIKSFEQIAILNTIDLNRSFEQIQLISEKDFFCQHIYHNTKYEVFH